MLILDQNFKTDNIKGYEWIHWFLKMQLKMQFKNAIKNVIYKCNLGISTVFSIAMNSL